MNVRAGILCVVGLCMLATTTLAHTNSNSRANEDKQASLEREILRLEEAGRQKILKGDNNWDDLIAEGAYMIAFDGSIIIYHKGSQFPPMVVKSFDMSEMIARAYGEVVIVTGLIEVAAESADKKPYSFKMRFLNVWKKSGDSWKIVVSERTGVRPPAK
jgi:hypothetical protein